MPSDHAKEEAQTRLRSLLAEVVGIVRDRTVEQNSDISDSKVLASRLAADVANVDAVQLGRGIDNLLGAGYTLKDRSDARTQPLRVLALNALQTASLTKDRKVGGKRLEEHVLAFDSVRQLITEHAPGGSRWWLDDRPDGDKDSGTILAASLLFDYEAQGRDTGKISGPLVEVAAALNAIRSTGAGAVLVASDTYFAHEGDVVFDPKVTGERRLVRRAILGLLDNGRTVGLVVPDLRGDDVSIRASAARADFADLVLNDFRTEGALLPVERRSLGGRLAPFEQAVITEAAGVHVRIAGGLDIGELDEKLAAGLVRVARDEAPEMFDGDTTRATHFTIKRDRVDPSIPSLALAQHYVSKLVSEIEPGSRYYIGPVPPSALMPDDVTRYQFDQWAKHGGDFTPEQQTYLETLRQSRIVRHQALNNANDHPYRDIVPLNDMTRWLTNPNTGDPMYGTRFLKAEHLRQIRDAIVHRLEQTVAEPRTAKKGYFLALPTNNELPQKSLRSMWFLATASENGRANQAHLFMRPEDGSGDVILGQLTDLSLDPFKVPLALIGMLSNVWHHLPPDATNPEKTIERLNAITI